MLLVAFLLWERRAPEPMLPLRFFKSRAFSATNAVSFAMFFGVFGSIFFLSQFFQTVQGYSPLESGLLTLPWTAMPMFVAPVAGLLSDRIGSRPLMALGLALQAVAVGWLAIVSEVDAAYSTLVPAFVLGGAGMGLVFAPSANAVLNSVRPEEAGQASGATNTIRELGGVMGIAILASVFSSAGGYLSPQDYVDGMTAALPVGVAVLAAGALAALLVPGRSRARAAQPARSSHGAARPTPRRRRGTCSKGGGPSPRGADRRRLPGRRYADGVSRFESKNLAAIRAALDQHNGSCPVPANAILLNPVDRDLIGWDELWGLPVLADERVPTKRVRIQCDGSAFGLEDELEEAIAREEPLIVPIVVPAGPADPARARRRRDLEILAGRHLEPAAERALEQLDLARGGPARDARLACADEVEADGVLAGDRDVRLGDVLVAASLEVLGEPQQHRAADEQVLVAGPRQRRERAEVGVALAVVAHRLADQRDLALREAREPGAEDQVARVLVMVVVVDRHADVVEQRRGLEQLALLGVARVKPLGGEFVEEAAAPAARRGACARASCRTGRRGSGRSRGGCRRSAARPRSASRRWKKIPSRSPASVASIPGSRRPRAPTG